MDEGRLPSHFIPPFLLFFPLPPSPSFLPSFFLPWFLPFFFSSLSNCLSFLPAFCICFPSFLYSLHSFVLFTAVANSIVCVNEIQPFPSYTITCVVPQEDIKSLCTHVCEEYFQFFEDVNYVSTFKGLLLRMEQEKDRKQTSKIVER